MTDSWKEREKAQEDQFFERQNKEALAKLKNKENPSPQTPSNTTAADKAQINDPKSK